LPKNSEKPCPFITEQPMAQEFDELPHSNKVSVAYPSCSLPMCHLFFLDIRILFRAMNRQSEIELLVRQQPLNLWSQTNIHNASVW
jgi:hypothetical protein